MYEITLYIGLLDNRTFNDPENKAKLYLDVLAMINLGHPGYNLNFLPVKNKWDKVCFCTDFNNDDENECEKQCHCLYKDYNDNSLYAIDINYFLKKFKKDYNKHKENSKKYRIAYTMLKAIKNEFPQSKVVVLES